MSKSIRSVYDLKHVSSVRAWALTFPLGSGNQFAGKVVANYSDNPAGSVCTIGVVVWEGPMKSWSDSVMIGVAGGYGYCKFSAAFASAIRKPAETAGFDMTAVRVSGSGESAVRAFLTGLGYTVMEVI